MKIFYIFIISLTVLPQLALAADPFPAWPMSFYGTASYDSSPLAAGTRIQAFAGDVLVGEVEMPTDGIYGYNNPTQSRLIVGEYLGDLLFKYLLAGESESVTGDTEIRYSSGFATGTAILFNLAFTKAAPPPSGGGGGSSGGGGYSPPPIPQPDSATTTDHSTSSGQENEEDVKVLGIEYDPYEDLTSLFGVASDIVETVSQSEAGKVFGQNEPIDLDLTSVGAYEKITGNKNLFLSQKYAIAYFIHYGTHTTMRLGAGERAGALNSCAAAFGKFPETPEEWMDVIKVANGRWPTQQSEAAEDRAKQEFKKIYLRESSMDNPHDNAAVTIMAYGLRPANRNLDSEKAAIKIFKSIFDYSPVSAVDWDMVRAIAYSGAIR